MKNIFTILLVLISSVSHLSLKAQSAAEVEAQTAKVEARANQFGSLLVQEKFEDAVGLLTGTLATKMDAAKMKQTWAQVTSQVGKVIKVDPAWVKELGEPSTTLQPIQFEKAKLDLKLAVKNDLKIGGFFFVMHSEKELELTETDKFKEEEILVRTKKFKLRGILSLPKIEGKVPAVVLVHGSGPQDMNVQVGPNAVFKMLSDKLASQGIAVIRYDKRTKVYGGDPKLDVATLTLYEETIQDAHTAVRLAKTRSEIDPEKVFVLGHSLGAMAAPRIAEMSNDIAGIVMMAGNARPLQDLLLDQYQHIMSPDGISDQEQAAIDGLQDQLKNLEKVKKGNHSPGDVLPLGLPMAYWKYLLDYNQVETAKDLTLPVLIAQGERDYQVTMKDYELWKKSLSGNKNVTFQSYPQLNHLLLEGEGTSYPSEYEVASEIPEYLIADVAKWMKAH